MEWFRPGLDRDELKKEYRKLCKQYHPDLSKDPNATEYMKEINYQFDQYYVHQSKEEYSWAHEERAARESRRVRMAILVRLYWNEDAGHYTTRIETDGEWYLWGYRRLYNIGHAVDIPGENTWEGFKGGLAYVSFEKPISNFASIILKRLPAVIEPASPEEVFWYNKSNWNNSETDRFIQADCKFGRVIFQITSEVKSWYDKAYGNMLMKCSLPNEFLLGEVDPKTGAKYAARSIQEVNVRIGSCGRLLNVVELTGADFPYMVYQDCSRDEFAKYHDMTLPEFSDLVPLVEVPVGFLTGERDPIVDYLHSKRIIRVFRYNRNFKIQCGMFDQRHMEENMELMGIEDAELIQDYLDAINRDFVEQAKKLLRKGKISSGI